MTHLTRDELIRWRDAGAESDRDRIVAHLAACASCAARLAELMRVAPADDAMPTLDPAEFVAQGYRAYQPAPARLGPVPAAVHHAPTPRTVWRPSGRWATAFAAAAILLAVLVVPRVRFPPRGSVMRGTAPTLQTIAPAGPITGPVDFTWHGVSAPAYLVDVLDADDAVLYQGRTSGTVLPWPPALTARLQAGRTYRWMVTALDARGETLASSATTMFTLRSPVDQDRR